MAVTTYRTKKNGTHYQAHFWRNKEKLASKAGFKTKRDAMRWLLETEKMWEKAETLITTGFASNAALYLDEMKTRRQNNTYSYKKAIINRLLDFMGGDFYFEDFTESLLEKYLHKRFEEKGAKTANRERLELSILWNWLIKKNIVQSNPFRSFEKFPEEKYIRKVPTAEEIAAARLAAKPDERYWIDALYFTGARFGEIAKLTWEDLNFERKTITLWTRKRKGGNKEPRTAAMPEVLYNLMKERWSHPDKHEIYVFPTPSGRPYKSSDWYISQLFHRICKRANIPLFTAHSIRHHVASRMKDSGKATSYQIQSLLGHQNHRTTEIYLHDLDIDRGVADIFDSWCDSCQPDNKRLKLNS